MRYFIYGAAVGVPGGLAIASLLGYHYTAYYLSWHFVETVWILLALLLFDALSHYWLKIRMRQRALEDAAELADVSKEGQSVQVDDMAIAIKDEELDAATINTQASKILRTLVVVGAVPNKHFITQQVLNWMSSDAIVRVTFPISVRRGTEVDRVKAILMEVASEHPMVLKEPTASIIFKGFGPGALQFDLRVFIRREDYAKVLDALNTAIEEGLKKADIEIAVDRQDIQVRSARDEPNKKPSQPFEPEPDEG